MRSVDVVTVILVAMVVAICLVIIRMSDRAKRESMNTAPRRTGSGGFTLIAMLRRADATGWWSGRWRNGFADVSEAGVRWRPRWPRPGPPVELGKARLAGPRPVTGGESVWIHRALEIYPITIGDKRYELALFPETGRVVNRLSSAGEPREGDRDAPEWA